MTGLYGFVVMAWLISSSGGHAHKRMIPFASMEACEVAKAELNRRSAHYLCIPTGAKP